MIPVDRAAETMPQAVHQVKIDKALEIPKLDR